MPPKRTAPTKRGVGRPSKYTPETVKRITDALSLGATRKLACEAAGLHVATFSEWMTENPAFAEVVTKAEGSAGLRALANIQAAARGNERSPAQWTASAWLLERTRPDEYGRRQVEVIGQGGGPVQVQAQIVVVPARAVSVQDWTATVRAPDAIPGPDALDKDDD